MFRKILLLFLLTISFFSFFGNANAARDCTTLGPSDLNTFKEYCYKITDAYLSLRNKYKVDGEIDTYIAGRILNYSRQGLNYLPDDLLNKNYYTHLQTAIERGIKDPKNNANFDSIANAIDDFLNKTEIKEINGEIEVFPASGNAPLTVTLRGNVSDPTGSKLESYNYTWWVLDGGKRRNIGNNKFLNYTFREEGNYSIFLDVTSNHRNSLKNIDVIPFSKRAEISVKEKVASLIVKVNSKSLDSNDELKFTPEDSVYGLLFDATSSTPTSGTKFVQTEWNFGNGIIRKYNSAPKIERVVYGTEGNYPVTLNLKTNTGKVIERKFTVVIRNPIATINASSLEGFLGDKFTFTANSFSKNDNLSYFWEIVDLKNDRVLFSKNLSTLSYSFTEKGRYNVKLSVTSPSGEKDYDNKIVYINSRPPFASFTSQIPNPSKPNTVLLDASSSYDLDFSDDGKLEYSWIINGDRVDLDNPNFNGSTGYYTFPNIGEQSIVLEVTDPDDLSTQKSGKVNITSNLSVDFFVFPRVSQVGGIMKFVADSPRAKFFEWDFGDSTIVGGKDDNITHKYNKSGIYIVKLSVRDENDLKNSFEKVVYVGDDDAPYAHISVKGDSSGGNYGYTEGVCNGKGAYTINKIDNVILSGVESINVTGETSGLDYSWKIGDKFYSTQDVSRRFDDIGCIPVKLTVKSQKNGKEAVAETYLRVQNLKPVLTGLDVQVKDLSTDPVIVDVRALGAVDRDGIIQSYLWYYYTDVSTEPQDFRATKTPSTTFVLPKITGKYYFVAVLKDNNEDRTSSEELSSSKYYVTLAGDNINTPIIALGADNTSVKAGEEVIFTVNVTNILGQNLNKDVKYSWDFDGDGFYDLETNKNTVSHKFTKSGETRVKVKVKNKGFSNTKTLTVNVSNILKPDFEYISIGNDYIFFDKSIGSADRYIWDMGDGQVLEKKGSFVYTYSDGKSTHLVKLKLVEGTNTKETSKKVVRDFGKMISTRKESLSIFSNHNIIEDKIILKEETPSLEFFLRTNLSNIKSYGVDFNIENDSDLNGGKDDDEDNKDTPGYNSGGPIIINLNTLKTQKIRIFLKDSSNKVIETKDITIIKEYVKEEESLPKDDIKLDGVSDSIKNTFNKIKEEVSKLDSENKIKALSYLQKLKEEWNDPREKTNVIMEFSSFIEGLKLQNGNEIISLIEGLLIEDSEKRTENELVFTALKNLIPKEIVCSGALSEEAETKKVTCQNLLIDKLQVISENNNLDENKALGKEILETISTDKTMTNEQKLDFKSLLAKLVNKDNAPEKGDITEVVEENGEDSGILGKILKWIMYIVLGILGLFIIGALIYFISYKLKGNKDSQSFTDYISEKTDNKKDVLSDNDSFSEKKDNSFDPLADDITTSNSENTKSDGNVPDWLKGNFEEDMVKQDKAPENISSESENIKEDVIDEKIENNSGDIPDWLLGKSEKVESKEKVVESKVNEFEEFDNNEELLEQANPKSEPEIKNDSKTNDSSSDIPDWLKSGNDLTDTEEKMDEFEEKSSSDLMEGSKQQDDEFVEDEATTKEEISDNKQENNVLTEDIPEWLKTQDNSELIEKESVESSEKQVSSEEVSEDIPEWLKVDENIESVEEKKIDDKQEENIVSEDIPEWLKTGTEQENDNDVLKEQEPKLETEEELNEFTKIQLDDDVKKEDDIPDWLKGSFSQENKADKNENDEVKETNKNLKTDDFANFESLGKKEEDKKSTKKAKSKKPLVSKKDEKNSKKINEDDSSDKKSLDDELWDDGMKIPDWLKTDSDK